MKTISYISQLVLLKELVMSKEEEEEEEKIAKSIILQEIHEIDFNASKVKENGCVACHVLFTLVTKMQISEQDASELLSEILSKDTKLNDLFIEMVESIHMKQRMMGVTFSIKTRKAKDRYIDSNIKNFYRRTINRFSELWYRHNI